MNHVPGLNHMLGFLPRLLAVLGLCLIVIVLCYELGRLVDRSTRVMRGTLSQQGAPLLPGAGDFVVFYTAGVMVRDGRAAELYEPAAIATEILRTHGYREPEREVLGANQEPFLRYYNPPVWALATVPLTYLPLRMAYRAMTVINLLALGAVCVMAAEVLNWKKLTVAIFLLGVFAYDPTHATLRGGQVSILIGLIAFLVFHLMISGKPKLAGSLLGLLFAKPQFLAFNAAAVLPRQRGAWLASGISISLAALPFLLVGLDGIADYIRLLATRTDLDINNAGFSRLILSWPGFYHALVGAPIDSLLLIALQGITVSIFGLTVWRGDLRLLPAAAAACSLIAIPHSHPQDWFLIVPGAAFLLSRPMSGAAFATSVGLLFLVFLGTNTWEDGLRAAGAGRGFYLATPAAFGLLVWTAVLPFLEARAQRWFKVPEPPLEAGLSPSASVATA